MSVLNVQPYPTKKGRERYKLKPDEPVWQLVHLFPYQGHWTEEEYLALNSNYLIEYSDGFLEVLNMPALSHQFIALFLYRLLWDFVNAQKSGWVLTAPLPVELWPKKYREPDIIYISHTHPEKIKGKYPKGADLVMEVVSDSHEDRERDYHTKRSEYAVAGISEYWIVDPQEKRITVLTLQGDSYAVHGEFKAGQQANSALLADFKVAVTAVFDTDIV